MTALIKYGVGGIMMVVLLGCQPTSAPTASVPSVSPEQFETPTPTPTPTDAQMLHTPQPSATSTTLAQASPQPVAQADSSEVSIASPPAGIYGCNQISGGQEYTLTLDTDGLYALRGIASKETGSYRLDGDTKIVWRTGTLATRYGGTSTLFVDTATNFVTLYLRSPGTDRSLDLLCARQP